MFLNIKNKRKKIIILLILIFILINILSLNVSAAQTLTGCQYDSHGNLTCTINKLTDSHPETIYGTPASSQSGFIYALRLYYQEYRLVLNAFIAITIITNMLILIYHFCSLAKVATSPKDRSRVINNILISCLCLALLGGSALIYVILIKI